MTEKQKRLINYDIIDIKEKDYIKYFKCIYLVKDFYREEGGDYILVYYFRSIKKENATLHPANSYRISGYLAERIKKATADETGFLISRIKTENPKFDFSSDIQETNGIRDLNVDECIAFLKSKGYLVYKPI